MYVCVCMCVYIYIYIYVYNTCVSLSLSISLSISLSLSLYIYIYIHAWSAGSVRHLADDTAGGIRRAPLVNISNTTTNCVNNSQLLLL